MVNAERSSCKTVSAAVGPRFAMDTLSLALSTEAPTAFDRGPVATSSEPHSQLALLGGGLTRQFIEIWADVFLDRHCAYTLST